MSWFNSSRASNTPNGRELVERGALLLDVRTPGEYASGHVDGATNIPVADLSTRRAEHGALLNAMGYL